MKYSPDFLIESVDHEGRQSFRSMRDTQDATGNLKWKRKSDLSNPESVFSGKGRISIKAASQQHTITYGQEEQRGDDPFAQSEGQTPLQKIEANQMGRPSQRISVFNKKYLGTTTEQRLSRISQIIMGKQAQTMKGQIYTLPEVDEECDLFEQAPPDEEQLRKMSIRSINVTQHMQHMQASTFSSILSRTSQILIHQKSMREANADRDSINFNDRSSNLDEQSNMNEEDEEDIDPFSKHRCSMIKQYNMPTFFAAVPEKRMQTPIKPQSYHKHITGLSTQIASSSESREKRDLNHHTVEEKHEHQEPVLQKDNSGSQGPSDEMTVLNLMHQSSSMVSEVTGDSQQSQQPSLQVTVQKPQLQQESQQQPYSFVEYQLERMSNIIVQTTTSGEESKAQSLVVVEQSPERSSLMVTGESVVQQITDEKPSKQLEGLVTKVQQQETKQGSQTTADLHQQHFYQTLQALEKITKDFSLPPPVQTLAEKVGLVYLPDPERPLEQRKVAIFDMDETLIHCVDDIEKENPEVILEIDFSPNQDGSNPEDIVCAGINIRPYIIECLEEAAKNFQVVVFTASHQTYADAILDYIDPNRTLISYRMYRQHCYLTPENYYVKDLRIIANRDLKDIVLVDNSVFSFAYQLDNGVPIVSFYRQPPQDEEMLHLIYYLSVLAEVDDVRKQNRQAFELHKLAGQQQEPIDSEDVLDQVTKQEFDAIPEVLNTAAEYDSQV